MFIFKIVLLVAAILVAAVLIFAATKPDTFRIERSIAIHATPEKIFPLLNDPRNGRLWSPYEKTDPDMKRTYSGAESGIGAIYEWDGNSQAGKGRIEVIDSRPASLVKLRLDFIKPFEAHNTAEFTLMPDGDNTSVTWAMYGPMPYASKIMTTFFSMDSIVGGQFEEGLRNLKAIVEKPAGTTLPQSSNPA